MSLLKTDAFIAPIEFYQPARWCVALSGGIDSIVLLHSMRFQLQTTLPIIALHVNHQLQSDANHWQQFCVDLCQQWQIPLQVLMVNVPKEAGDSLEANARTARYQALLSHLTEKDVLLTAHHQDDQAETVLLQLLRGAGPKGLAAMPLYSILNSGILQYRPLLHTSRADIEAYATAQQLSYIEDKSNLDEKFDRNYLRHQVMPLLKQRWPSCAATFARSAYLSAQLVAAQTPLWQEKLAACLMQDKLGDACLDLAKLITFSQEECSEVLRLWFESLGLLLPSFAQMQQMLAMIYHGRGDSHAKVEWHQHVLTRYQDKVYVLALEAIAPYLGVLPWDVVLQPIFFLEDRVLQCDRSVGQGIAVRYLQDCEIRFRDFGERFHPAGRTGSHPLKKLFQEWEVPPWQRQRIPLLYAKDELIAVIGFAYKADKLAVDGEEGVTFTINTSM